MGSASRLLVLLVLGSLALASSALAETSHDRTQFGHDITVGMNETASDVTCFGCTVRIHGNVTGDVTVFGGNILIEENGEVAGDTTDFGGDLRLDSGAKVRDVTVFGGKVRRDPSATVQGDVTTFAGGAALWLFLIFGLPFLILAGFVVLIIWLIRRFSRPAMPLTARI